MSAASREDSISESPYNLIALKAVLIAVAIACIASFWMANSRTDDYRLNYELFSPWLWNLYLSFYLASVAALFSMWNWHKWGIWLLGAMAVAIVFTETYAMGFSVSTLRVPVMFAAVWFAARPLSNRFV